MFITPRRDTVLLSLQKNLVLTVFMESAPDHSFLHQTSTFLILEVLFHPFQLWLQSFVDKKLSGGFIGFPVTNNTSLNTSHRQGNMMYFMI